LQDATSAGAGLYLPASKFAADEESQKIKGQTNKTIDRKHGAKERTLNTTM